MSFLISKLHYFSFQGLNIFLWLYFYFIYYAFNEGISYSNRRPTLSSKSIILWSPCVSPPHSLWSSAAEVLQRPQRSWTAELQGPSSSSTETCEWGFLGLCSLAAHSQLYLISGINLSSALILFPNFSRFIYLSVYNVTMTALIVFHWLCNSLFILFYCFLKTALQRYNWHTSCAYLKWQFAKF